MRLFGLHKYTITSEVNEERLREGNEILQKLLEGRSSLNMIYGTRMHK
jgi:hypothetical protein